MTQQTHLDLLYPCLDALREYSGATPELMLALPPLKAFNLYMSLKSELLKRDLPITVREAFQESYELLEKSLKKIPEVKAFLEYNPHGHAGQTLAAAADTNEPVNAKP